MTLLILVLILRKDPQRLLHLDTTSFPSSYPTRCRGVTNVTRPDTERGEIRGGHSGVLADRVGDGAWRKPGEGPVKTTPRSDFTEPRRNRGRLAKGTRTVPESSGPFGRCLPLPKTYRFSDLCQTPLVGVKNLCAFSSV